MELATLRPEERAALAKAEASGVNITVDGKDVPLTRSEIPAATTPTNSNTDAQIVTEAPKPAATAPAPAKATRPDHVPEKFWNAEKGEVNVEAMAKSYAELERQRSAAPKPAEATPPAMADATPAATTPPEGETPEAKATREAAEAAAKSPQDLAAARQSAADQASKDLATTGKISDATYEALEKVGYDRKSVDNYVEGQQAKSQLLLNSVYEAAGGKENYTKMIEWGKTAYSAEEVAAFDAALRSGDAGQMKLAVGGLKARYGAEFGQASKTTITPTPAQQQSNNTGFKNAQEMRDAMKDPRYTKGDAAYHREVQEKLAAADRAGVDLGIKIHGR